MEPKVLKKSLMRSIVLYDNRSMRKVLLLLFISILSSGIFAYKIKYVEGFYSLYVENFYKYPEDVNRNIYYLKAALDSDFRNPLYAIATIKDKNQWEKYRYLMYTHINLKLVDSYIQLASVLDKHEALFYNEPWKEYNIKSLNQAELYYKEAEKHWVDAVEWSNLAAKDEFMFLFINELNFFEDESYMIQSGELNYRKIIEKHLTRLNRVRDAFKNMDKNTY